MEENIQSNGIIIGKHIFKIGNKTIYLNCGEFHYFRVKRDEWEDRLTKAQEMGLNAISTYIAWNYHEIEDGIFDFSSYEKDLDHFFHLCENRGLYILVRMGPYISGGIKNGGIPQWLIDDHPKLLCLNDKLEPTPRTQAGKTPISYPSQVYLKYVERYIKQLSEVLRRHIYPHGGIILLQIDDEISYEGYTGIFDLDYNPMHLEIYRRFLENKYKKIQLLNTAYNTKYLDFRSIQPPTNDSFIKAANSINEFDLNGEFNRLIDWMESKEFAIQDFVSQVCYFLRKSSIQLPFYTNISTMDSPSNPILQYNAYKTKVMIGIDINFKNFEEPIQDFLKIEYQFEKLRSQISNLVFVTEFRTGDHQRFVSSMHTHNMLRLTLGQGMNAINYYMAVGGVNPFGTYKNEKFSYSAYFNTLKFDGEKYINDDTGQSFDFGAPIGEKGQKNTRYNVIKTFSQYLLQHKDGLITSEKLNDPIVILHYFPYTRINFDSKKLKSPINYGRYTREPNSATRTVLKTLNLLGFHPRILDLQCSNLKDIQSNKIAFIWLCNFMDKDSIQKIISYVESGGILISFGDIPSRDELGIKNNALVTIYRAAINNEENYQDCRFLGNNIKTSDSFATFKFAKNEDDLSIESKYSSENISNEDIISERQDGDKRKITGFHRSFGKGHFYHFGYVFNPGTSSDNFLIDFFNKLGFTSKLAEGPPEGLIILRQRNQLNEEYITVSNLTQNDITCDKIKLNNVKNLVNDSDQIILRDLIIPKQTSIQWLLHKKVNDYSQILFCSSEINRIVTIRRTTPIQHIIEGYHFENSMNQFELALYKKPSKIIRNGQDITSELENNKCSDQIHLEEKIKSNGEIILILTLKYSDTITLDIDFSDSLGFNEIILFRSEKTSIFKD